MGNFSSTVVKQVVSFIMVNFNPVYNNFIALYIKNLY